MSFGIFFTSHATTNAKFLLVQPLLVTAHLPFGLENGWVLMGPWAYGPPHLESSVWHEALSCKIKCSFQNKGNDLPIQPCWSNPRSSQICHQIYVGGDIVACRPLGLFLTLDNQVMGKAEKWTLQRRSYSSFLQVYGLQQASAWFFFYFSTPAVPLFISCPLGFWLQAHFRDITI